MRYLMVLLPSFFFFAFPAALSAQSIVPEFFARAGFATLWDDEGNIGTGPSIGAGAGMRLPLGVGIEGLVERHRNDKKFESGVNFGANAASITLRVAKYFGTSPTQFYAGGAVGRTSLTSYSQFPGQNRRERSTTSPTVGGFAGVRLTMGARGFARPEVELSRSGEFLRIAGSLTLGLSF